MRSKNSFTDDEIKEMIKLHDNGLRNIDIADIFDTSKTMISRIFNELQIPSKHPPLTEERELQIKTFYESCFNINKTCKEMHCGLKTVDNIIKKYNLKKFSKSQRRRKYDIDEHYFENIDTANKAYSLGMFYSDGTVGSNTNIISISLQSRDKDIIDKLNHEFGGDRKLTFIELNNKNPNWQNQYMLSINCKVMHDDLIKHGCVPKKSLILEFPKDVDEQYIRDFCRGVFDGDGNISKNEYRCTLISTESFCKSLQDIVKKELGINSSIFYCHDEEKSTRIFQVAGKYQVKKFLDWLYQDSDLYLDRKYNQYIEKYYS